MIKIIISLESPCLQYGDVNNFYGWIMLQKFPVNDFKWVEDIYEFNDDIKDILI